MWIKYKDSKPETDIVALVCNEKGWMGNVQAIYIKSDDVWRHSDPNYRETLLLDVTHYLPIPLPPRIF